MSRCMIVDDDETICEWLGAILRSEGHTVVAANCGIGALDILDSDRPLDLMVTDIMMPGLNGFNLARMARMRRPALKFLYISGHPAEVGRDQGTRLGELLAKPLRYQEVTRAVTEALAATSH